MKKFYSFLSAFVLMTGSIMATGHTATTTIVNHVTCPGSSDGKAYVTVSGGVGPFTYSWNSTPTQTTDTLFNAPAGNYICIITDQSDMSAYTATLTINPGVNLVATNNGPVCQGGQIQLMASAGSNFSWTGPMGFISTVQNPMLFTQPGTAGNYTVSGTSSTGCVSTATTIVTMFQSPIVTASTNGVTCIGNCDGTGFAMASGGTPPYAYLWTPFNMTGQTVGGLCGMMSFTVMATDANGCVGTTTTFVTQPQQLIVSLSPTQPSSCGACDGSITAAVTGGTPPYTYMWTNGSTTQNLTALCPGTYTLQVTDANGCSFSDVATITSSGTLTANATVTPDTCGQSVGTATANVSGAQGPVTYMWMPGNYTTQSIFNVPAGTYSLTILDTACAYTTNVTISNFGSPTVVATSNPASCGNANGVLVLTANGGTPGYQYSINGGAFGPNQTYPNMLPGTYTIVCQDANGCFSTTITYPVNNTGMNVYFSTGNATCGNSNGTSYAYTAGGGTAPYTYSWTPGGYTTQTVNNLAPGTYTCTITDAGGCVATGTTTVGTQPTLYQNWSCAYYNCGVNVLDATAQTGTGPFTYLWAPGGQTTPVITNQAPGTYTCTVTDQSTGCTGVGYYYIYNSGYSIVSGNVFADLNGDCNMDSGENIYTNLAVSAVNASGQIIGWANSNYQTGNFQMYLPPTAGTYTLQLNSPYAYNYSSITFNCPITITLSGNCDTLQNVQLGYSPVIGPDLHIASYCSIARPGFQRPIYITYFNAGTTTLNATVKLKMDNLLSFQGSTPPPTATTGNIIEWNVGNLVPGQAGSIYATELVPTIQAGGALGTPLYDSLWIEPIVGDNYVSDNYSNCQTTITGSYDPNFKEAWAENMDATGAIDTAATEMYYTVHFQNTGSDTAFTIVVRDTISPLLDLNTLEMIAGSHPYTYSIEPDRTLQVRFDNILLVDSNQNEALSHGYFHYKIRTNGGLSVGDQIDNTAGIYFDFNLPIITNTVETPVQLNTVGIKNTKTQLQAHVFPNPSNTGSFTIRINDASYKQLHFTMYNAAGMKVADKQLPSQPTHEISTAGLGSGIYFYQLINADGKKLNGKIVLAN